MFLKCLEQGVGFSELIIKSRTTVSLMFFLYIFLDTVKSLNIDENKDTVHLWAVVGKRADLPCPSSPRTNEEMPVLVLWYKDTLNHPVYSYDARKGDFSSGVKWSNRTIFGGRAYFSPLSSPPSLILENVEAQDQGLFTCRLDYPHSPTVSYSTRLGVLIYPSKPEITWNGRHVSSHAGPMKENSTQRFTCSAHGGRPMPSLIWWVENRRAVNQRMEVREGRETKSLLVVMATRSLNRKNLYCHAHLMHSGFPITQPLTAAVKLSITLPPQGIKLTGGESPVSVNSTLSLLCVTWGANPGAELSWWKSGRKIKTSTSIADDSNVTTSKLLERVSASDHGTTFICEASNPLFGGAPLVASLRLHVLYKPIVKLKVKINNQNVNKNQGNSQDQGNSLEHGTSTGKIRMIQVKQGSDVHFECSTEANPIPDYTEWLRNGAIVKSGKEEWSLLLPKVTKGNSGEYSCAAINKVGHGRSTSVGITVEHPPECAVGWHKKTLGAEVGKKQTVLCRVDALPAVDVSFSWSRINKASGETHFESTQIQIDGTTSRLTVNLNSVNDYGALYCRARNSVGTQKIPCMIALVPASPPDPPFNCSTDQGEVSGSIEVTCMEGFDGGFLQKFNLVAVQRGKVIVNITRNFPEWYINNLDYGKGITLRVHAINARGRSEPVRMETFIQYPQPPHKQDPKPKDDQHAPLPLMGVFIGTGVVLITAIIVMITFVCVSRNELTSWKTKTPKTCKRNQKCFSNGFPISKTIKETDCKSSGNGTSFKTEPDIMACYASRKQSFKSHKVSRTETHIRESSSSNKDDKRENSFQSYISFSNISSPSNFSQENGITEASRKTHPDSHQTKNIFTEDVFSLDKSLDPTTGAISKRSRNEEYFIDTVSNKVNPHRKSPNQLGIKKQVSLDSFLTSVKNKTSSDGCACSKYLSVSTFSELKNDNFHYVDSQQAGFSRLAINIPTHSITYSNARCVHYRPYHVYKQVQCYPPTCYANVNEYMINDPSTEYYSCSAKELFEDESVADNSKRIMTLEPTYPIARNYETSVPLQIIHSNKDANEKQEATCQGYTLENLKFGNKSKKSYKKEKTLEKTPKKQKLITYDNEQNTCKLPDKAKVQQLSVSFESRMSSFHESDNKRSKKEAAGLENLMLSPQLPKTSKPNTDTAMACVSSLSLTSLNTEVPSSRLSSENLDSPSTKKFNQIQQNCSSIPLVTERKTRQPKKWCFSVLKNLTLKSEKPLVQYEKTCQKYKENDSKGRRLAVSISEKSPDGKDRICIYYVKDGLVHTKREEICSRKAVKRSPSTSMYSGGGVKIKKGVTVSEPVIQRRKVDSKYPYEEFRQRNTQPLKSILRNTRH